MSTAPETDSSKSFQKFKDCFSCRVISGGGLILSAAYVFLAARKVAQRRGPTMGTAVQVTFAASLIALGAVIINDPVGKMERKASKDDM